MNSQWVRSLANLYPAWHTHDHPTPSGVHVCSHVVGHCFSLSHSPSVQLQKNVFCHPGAEFELKYIIISLSNIQVFVIYNADLVILTNPRQILRRLGAKTVDGGMTCL